MSSIIQTVTNLLENGGSVTKFNVARLLTQNNQGGHKNKWA